MVSEGLCCGSINPKNEKLWLAYKKKKLTQKKTVMGRLRPLAESQLLQFAGME